MVMGLRKGSARQGDRELLQEGCRAPPINCVLPGGLSGWRFKAVIGARHGRPNRSAKMLPLFGEVREEVADPRFQKKEHFSISFFLF